jgi:hypothetical protein
MTLQQLHSEFPYTSIYEEILVFFFISEYILFWKSILTFFRPRQVEEYLQDMELTARHPASISVSAEDPSVAAEAASRAAVAASIAAEAASRGAEATTEALELATMSNCLTITPEL